MSATALLLLAALPAAAAAVCRRLPPAAARPLAVSTTLTTLALAAALALRPGPAPASGSLFALDDLSALLLPFAALLFAVVVIATPRSADLRRGVSRALASEALVLATFSCQDPLALAALWAAAFLPLAREPAMAEPGAPSGLRMTRAYLIGSALLFAAGALLLDGAEGPSARAWGSALALAAILVRKGIVPLHSWTLVLFERAPLPAAIAFVTPQLGTYAAARLVAPAAPPLVLLVLGSLSLATAVYAAGLGLVQRDGRRAFGCLFMSQSALALAGLECASAVGLTGALALWLSSSLALTGFGMTLCVLEARRGELDLGRYHGGYESTPLLARSFLLLGLCSVGFPGTLGFVGSELLFDGSVLAHPQVGAAVGIASVLNGITVLRMYFALFAGARRPLRPELRLRWREQLAFGALLVTLLATGLVPQPVLSSRRRAADAILEAREALALSSPESRPDRAQPPDPSALRRSSLTLP